MEGMNGFKSDRGGIETGKMKLASGWIAKFKSDRGGIETLIVSVLRCCSQRSNQTVAGLKLFPLYHTDHESKEFKSDRGGIETCRVLRYRHNQGMFKSDRGGIETP